MTMTEWPKDHFYTLSYIEMLLILRVHGAAVTFRSPHCKINKGNLKSNLFLNLLSQWPKVFLPSSLTSNTLHIRRSKTYHNVEILMSESHVNWRHKVKRSLWTETSDLCSLNYGFDLTVLNSEFWLQILSFCLLLLLLPLSVALLTAVPPMSPYPLYPLLGFTDFESVLQIIFEL